MSYMRQCGNCGARVQDYAARCERCSAELRPKHAMVRSVRGSIWGGLIVIMIGLLMSTILASAEARHGSLGGTEFLVFAGDSAMFFGLLLAVMGLIDYARRPLADTFPLPAVAPEAPQEAVTPPGAGAA